MMPALCGSQEATTCCPHCEDGTLWTSRHGGNDPDVWPAGPCDACDGEGNALCDETGCHATATNVFTGRGHNYPLCAAHHTQWLEDTR